MDKLSKLRTTLDRKRRAFARFDALPPAEQRRLTSQGKNPHESPEVRKARKRLYVNKILRSVPPEERKILKNLLRTGESGEVVRRQTGFFLTS